MRRCPFDDTYSWSTRTLPEKPGTTSWWRRWAMASPSCSTPLDCPLPYTETSPWPPLDTDPSGLPPRCYSTYSATYAATTESRFASRPLGRYLSMYLSTIGLAEKIETLPLESGSTNVHYYCLLVLVSFNSDYLMLLICFYFYLFFFLLMYFLLFFII